tara:strand:+ start:4273 stop:4644 length:372 start_codon:yes stop_codon:yes gene_type:complete
MLIIFTSAIILLILDYLYLSSVGRYFGKQIMSIQKSPMEIDALPTILTYVFIIFGLYYFILKERKGIFDAFLLGLVIYMIFEGTNKALFSNWSWKTVAIDGIWGGILFALTTAITYKIYSYLK